MQCNIDARGKFNRLVMGLLILGAAGLYAALILIGLVPGGWGWLAVAMVGVAGAFGVFEARAGWCLMRAMGFKTPW